MKATTIGRSGIRCETVGLGTWAMGGWMWGGNDDAAALEGIRASLDAGIRFIDTAPAYGLGRAERLVGAALEGRRREDVVIATKCGLVWHTRQGTHFFDEAGMAVFRHLGRASILHEVEQSLARLKTDYIDLYFTHWQDSTTPIAETMDTLSDLKAKGTIRAIGISNASPEVLREYLKHGQIDAVQERYSLLDREIEAEIVPICQANGVSVVGYSSMALGLLSGPIPPERQFTGDDQRATDPRFSAENRARLQKFFDAIEPVRARHQCSFAQLMVAWTVAHGSVSIALCGARNPRQAAENAGAARLTLSSTDLAAIKTAAHQTLGEAL
ncbi:aldo/keto reductase [Piscinibacter sp. HJYY11]|uniref:aldo/keto reductase n=1 Tax=Piscinibacter sp. HJYY11 TaxID=2801333 RepID=UPI00191FD53B|nr:aldo/keto reductase [Piscinibacter sp. HJYY11]MBL0728134.1 aldo/keto reductase [Piscinibacter sp. HJYY11]